MLARALHLDPGSDVRRSLEQLARSEQASGFVLSVVGNLSQATFGCPGRNAPTVLSGELEIITLQGTISPEGVHLHLSFSDGNCQVWGGHLEHDSLVLKGADLLVGFLTSPPTAAVEARHANPIRRDAAPARLTIAVAKGCPWSSRALRMLRTLSIPYALEQADGSGSLPRIRIDGRLIGGYSELAELHGRGELESLRHG